MIAIFDLYYIWCVVHLLLLQHSKTFTYLDIIGTNWSRELIKIITLQVQ